jgi:type I restriction enzyme, S subunit
VGDDGWRTTDFATLIADGLLEIGDGYRAKNSELGGGGPIFLRAGHVRDTHIDFSGVDQFHARLQSKVASKLARVGDVIITTKGNSTGRVAFVTARDPAFVYSPHLSYWRSRSPTRLLPGFLRYWSRSAEFMEQLAALAGSTDMAPYLSLVDQRRLRITVPSPAQQRAIASILGALDDKIDLNRRMNETLEGIARALFKSWFVDFDPVRAKSVGRAPAIPDSLARLFPNSFANSRAGTIPKGWTPGVVGDHMVNSDSKRVPVPSGERAKRRGQFPYHGAAVVLDHIDDFLFDGIYLLVGEDGSVVRDSGMAVTQYVWGQFWVNNHAHVLQGRGAVSTEQLYLYFDFELVVPYVTGAVQPKLSQGRMNTMPFVFAGEDVCAAFTGAVRPLFAGLRVNADMNKHLVQLRDALLPKLLSGEIRVRDAERVVEKVI